MAFFPADGMNGKVSGAIVEGPMHQPSMDGTIVYLNANPAIQTIIDRIEPNGVKFLCLKLYSPSKLVIWLSLLIRKETGWPYMQEHKC
jgi:predicted enzyme related to lactoylglutathione lyase